MEGERNWLERNFLRVLYTIYIISLILMIGTIFCFIFYLYFSLTRIDGINISHGYYDSAYGVAMSAFFGAPNAMVIFRAFALNLRVVIIHALLHSGVLVSLVLNTWVYYGDENRNFFEVYQFPNLLLISCFILQICAALFLVVFQRGTTTVERQKHAAIHSLMALITFVIHLWNMLLNISMLCSSATHHVESNIVDLGAILWVPLVMGTLIYFYSLAIIVILLTPYFESDYRANLEAEEESIEKQQMEEKGSSLRDPTEPPMEERSSPLHKLIEQQSDNKTEETEPSNK